MSGLRVQSKRKLWIGAAVTFLFLSTLGCSMSDLLPAPTATATPLPTSTHTLTLTPSSTATITLTPSPQGLVPATAKPTLRPSWTPIPTNTLRPTWTASPTLSPTATPEVGILLEENFDDPLTPWMKKAFIVELKGF